MPSRVRDSIPERVVPGIRARENERIRGARNRGTRANVPEIREALAPFLTSSETSPSGLPLRSPVPSHVPLAQSPRRNCEGCFPGAGPSTSEMAQRPPAAPGSKCCWFRRRSAEQIRAASARRLVAADQSERRRRRTNAVRRDHVWVPLSQFQKCQTVPRGEKRVLRPHTRITIERAGR